MNLSQLYKFFFIAVLSASSASAQILDTESIGLSPEKQTIHYWLEQGAKKSGTSFTTRLLSFDQIDDINQRLRETESSYTDIKKLPIQMDVGQIRNRIIRLSKRPNKHLYNQNGDVIPDKTIDHLLSNLNLATLKGNQILQFGLITKRATLRTFPTDLRAFKRPGDTDIDRFQETALFPGAPVVILLQSTDKKWVFIVSEWYSAWVKSEFVALGSQSEVIKYMESKPRVVITDANAHTAFTPDRPEVSNLSLDMGVSLPWIKQWPITEGVNGQGSLGSFVISLPIRNQLGRLELIPALLPNKYNFQEQYLQISEMDLLLQSSKFLGERYGWGHDYGTRDCSGFVSEVYRSMGLLLPRNTSDQERSLAYDREPFEAALSHEQRLEKIKDLRIGDLIYIPGHVMMVIGHDDFGPWVIHDSHGTGFLQNGSYFAIPTNGVAITPLLNMALSADKTYVDAITSIQHIIPRQNK